MVFDYVESWLNRPGATPLSQSLPLRKERFKRNECRGFFAGILPEESKREIIARNLGISARNDYAMLEQIGGECAGAVTFIPGGRGSARTQLRLPHALFARTRRDTERTAKAPAAGRRGRNTPFACRRTRQSRRAHRRRRNFPASRRRAEHAYPETRGRTFRGVVFNEALCMKLAAAAGLPAATVETRNVEEWIPAGGAL